MSGLIYQSATEISVGERDGSVTVTFLRSGDLSGPVNVTYDITSEGASAGLDFIGASGTTRFEAGQSQVSLNFQILNDNLSEATETFVVGLVGADNGASLGLPRTVRVNVLDDENPVLPPSDPPLTSPYRVNTETFVSGMTQPINFEFSPINSDIVYVAEKGGLIRTFNLETGADLGNFIDLRSVVNENGDRGLMDIAIHPDFPASPYIYAFYVVEPAGLAADSPGNRFSHVVRFTADASADYLRVVPNSGVVIAGQTGRSAADINGGGLVEYTFPEYSNQLSSEQYLRPNDPNPPMVIGGFKQNYLKVDTLTHAGGSLAFGPDGMLYISTGDGSSPNYADPRATNVQNLNSLNGKILRVDPMTGQGLTDNPFYQSGQSLDANISKVYQYGLRNPFSIAFDDLGRLFIADTGWKAYEEVNHGPPGANFGWPYYEGKEGGQLAQTTGYNVLPGASAFYANVANGSIVINAPYAAFGHATAVPGYANQVITGGAVIYDGDKYPAALQNDFFFTNFESGTTFTVDTNNRQEVNYLFTSSSPYAPVHFNQGADGYVYYADLIDGSIGRIYINDPNVARVTVTAATGVNEGAGTVQATFTLSAAQSTPTVITYSTANGTATAGLDFVGRSNATVTIPAGQTSVTIQIPLIDDTVDEFNETFQIRLESATAGATKLAAFGGATVYILDNDAQPPGNLLINGSFESTTIPTGSSNYASIPGWTALTGTRIELWNAHRGTIASDGNNYAELDFDTAWDGFYQDVQTTAGRAHTLTFDLRLRADRANTTPGVEILWNGTVVATTSPGANWASFTVSNLVGTGGLDRLTVREVQSQSSDGLGALLDNFRLVSSGGPAQPTVSVSASPSSVAEAAGASANVTFTLSAAQANNVTVTYSTANGTATAGSDFTGATNATATILAGQTSVTVQIPLINDNVAEPSETFSVNLVGATLNGNAIPASGSTTITITDNDAPPSGTNLLVNGSFEATTIPTGSSNYASIPGWTALTGARIELWNANRNVTATDGTNFAELDFDTAWDGFYQDVQTTAGQAHTLTFDLRLRADKPVTTPGVEILWNGTVVATTSPGTNWGSFTVSNLVGTGGLDRLTVREVQSQSSDGLGALLDNFRLVSSGGPAQPTVSVSASPLSVAEAAGGSANVTFTLSAAQANNVTVTYSTANGTATAGSDFAGATNATATILAGQTSVTVQIPLINDNVAEPSETFSVNLVGATLNGNAIPASGNATITVTDNDAPQPSVTITAAPATVAEAAGANAGVTFTLSAAQANNVMVTYSTANGTATAGSDFTGATNATATILAGQTSVTVQIPLINDNVAEPSETFSVNLVGATLNGNAIPASGSTTITITDNDPPPSGTNLLVNGSFEATTIPAGSSNYASLPGWTALAGARIELWNAHRSTTASDGSNYAELDFDTAWDGFYQDVQTTAGQAHTLTFDLRLRADKPLTTPAGLEILWNGAVVATTTPSANWGSFTVANLVGTGGLDRLTVREVQSQSADGLGALLDNFKLVSSGGPVQPTVSVSASPSSVAEAAGANAGVTFTLSAAQADNVTVTYSTANGTATAGSDFAGATNTTAVILAGQTSVTAQIPLINDTVAEPSETFAVNLVGATLNGNAIPASGSATITITDNDLPPSGANLLVNGSFEASTIPNGSSNYTAISGWTAIPGGTIELWKAHRSVTATDGTNFAELDFSSAWDGFYQDVQTSAGQSHTLTFDLRRRVDIANTTPGIEILWNGAVVATTTPGANWGSFTVSNLVGTGGLDRLTVRELQSQSSDGVGALLDNFKLVTDPAAPLAQMSLFSAEPSHGAQLVEKAAIGNRFTVEPSDWVSVWNDKVDVSTIDASTKQGGDQAFAFIGGQPFDRVAGQLRADLFADHAHVMGDINGDGVADFDFQLAWHDKDHPISLGADDFIL